MATGFVLRGRLAHSSGWDTTRVEIDPLSVPTRKRGDAKVNEAMPDAKWPF